MDTDNLMSELPVTPGESNPTSEPAPVKRKRQRKSAEERQRENLRLVVKSLTDRTARGDRDAATQLDKLLAGHPWVLDEVASLAAEVETAWVERAAHTAEGNRAKAARYRIDLAALRTELLGTNPSPVERMLVEHLAIAHLAYQEAELWDAAGSAASPGRAGEYRIKRLGAAQRRLLAAIKMLDLVRSKPVASD